MTETIFPAADSHHMPYEAVCRKPISSQIRFRRNWELGSRLTVSLLRLRLGISNEKSRCKETELHSVNRKNVLHQFKVLTDRTSMQIYTVTVTMAWTCESRVQQLWLPGTAGGISHVARVGDLNLRQYCLRFVNKMLFRNGTKILRKDIYT